MLPQSVMDEHYSITKQCESDLDLAPVTRL